MAPILRPRQSLSKERLPTVLGSIKAVSYLDTTTNARLSGPTHIRTIAWNPLGNLVATGAADKTLRVWNPEKPQVRMSTELKGHAAAIDKVAFNPVKDAELCSISEDGVCKVWDVRNKACVNEVKDLGSCHALDWAPDGSTMVVGNRGGQLFVLSPALSTPLSTHQLPTRVNQMAMCWSGQKLFLPTADGTLRVLSYPDFQPLLFEPHSDSGAEFVIKGHTSSCLTAALSPSGRYVATGGADSIMALFDTKDWICQRTVTSISGPVRNISFSWDGSYVVGGCEDGSGLDITHVETGELVHSLNTAGPCEAVAWAPLKYALAYSDLGVLRILGVDGR